MKKILFVLLFLLSLNLVSARNITNSRPEITVIFNESVKLIDYSLRSSFFGTTYYYPLTNRTADNKTFIFNSTNSLNDGEYIFKIIVRDLVENELDSKDQEHAFEISVGMNILLKNPKYGVSKESVFDLVIETTTPSNLCKYSVGSFDIPFLSQSDPKYSFVTTDNTIHTLKGFSELQGEKSEKNIYVKCRTKEGVINENKPKLFTLSVDSTAPEIIKKYSVPDEIVYGDREAILYVETDDKTICKYYYENIVYSLIPEVAAYKFNNFDSKLFSTLNSVKVTNLRDGLNTFYIACMNGAEIPSITVPLTVKVNYSAPNKIRTEPSGIINNRSVTLTVYTNKPASCIYEDSLEKIKNLTPNLKKVVHTDFVRSLSNKNYTYYVSCTFNDQETIHDTINFIVDWTAPSAVLTPLSYSCSNKFVRANISATDNYGIKYYQVWLRNSSNSALTKYYTIESDNNGSKMEIELTDLNLEFNKSYYWAAVAFDVAGNPSPEARPSTPTLIIDNESSDKRCDEKDPPTTNLKKRLMNIGINITIECRDSGSGCDEDSFKYQLVSYLTGKCGTPSTYLRYPGSVLITRNMTFCYYVCDVAKNCIALNESVLVSGEFTSNISLVKDTDNDGLSDEDEVNIHNTDPYDPDTDGDGFLDGVEVSAGTDPLDPNDFPGRQSTNDADGDGMADSWETLYCNGHCDPDADPDRDGLSNLEEYKHKTDPTKDDTDGDGYSDKVEIDEGTDPLDPESYPQKEKSRIFPLFLLILGILLVLGSVSYLLYDYFSTKPKGKKEYAMYKTPQKAPVTKTQSVEDTRKLAKAVQIDKNKRKETEQEIIERRKEKKKQEKEKVFDSFTDAQQKPEKKEQEEDIKKLEIKGPQLKGIKKLPEEKKTDNLDKRVLYAKLDKLGKESEGFQRLNLLIQKKEQLPFVETKERLLKQKSLIEPVKEQRVEKIILQAKELPELKTQRAVKESSQIIFNKLNKLGHPQVPVQKMLKANKVKKEQIVNIFADLSENKPMSADLFKQILNLLLQTGKISKQDVASILFDYMQKDLITKAEVADVLASLRLLK